jgi:hypothetical protein
MRFNMFIEKMVLFTTLPPVGMGSTYRGNTLKIIYDINNWFQYLVKNNCSFGISPHFFKSPLEPTVNWLTLKIWAICKVEK